MNGVLIEHLYKYCKGYIAKWGINRTSYKYCKGKINGVLIEHLKNIVKDKLMGY